MRYLAIDYGARRTGLAVSDADEKIASPLTILDGQQNLIERIAAIAEEQNAGAVVVGLPLNMDGSRGFQSKRVLNFAGRLKKRLHVPLYLQDERLSSFDADEKLSAAQFSKKEKQRRRDAVAAARILQDFLEQKREKSD
jgi:putative Holliday junction resolvase